MPKYFEVLEGSADSLISESIHFRLSQMMKEIVPISLSVLGSVQNVIRNLKESAEGGAEGSHTLDFLV